MAPSSSASPQEADPVLAFMILNGDLPALIGGLFCAGTLSASMSTGDALPHATASVTVEDGVRPFWKLSDLQQHVSIGGLVLAAAAVVHVFALDPGQSLVMLLLTTYGIVRQFPPPILAALYWRRAPTAGAIAGLLAGTATATFFFLVPDLHPLDLQAGPLGLLVHVPGLVGISLLAPEQKPDRMRRFVEDEVKRRGAAEVESARV